MIKFNDDFTLNYVEENMIKEGKLITAEVWFTFFGKDYVAYLSVDSLEKESLRYPSVEGPSILFESFQESLESNDVEKIVRDEAKKYIQDGILIMTNRLF